MTSAEKSTAGNYDEKTGLLSREGFELVAFQTILRSARHAEQLSLVLLRMITLAPLDTELSGLAANSSFVELSWLIRSNVRASDVVARVSPNEIAVLLPKTDRQQGLDAVEQLASIAAREEVTLLQSAIVEIGLATFDPVVADCKVEAMLESARLEITFTELRWPAP